MKFWNAVGGLIGFSRAEVALTLILHIVPCCVVDTLQRGKSI